MYIKVYESLRATNLNHDQQQIQVHLLIWIEVSPTNRWKMFDTSNTTQTTNNDNIVVSTTSGKGLQFCCFFLLGLEATSVRVKMTDPQMMLLF